MPGAQGPTCSPAGRTTLPDSPGPATPTRPGWCRSSGSGPRQSYTRGPRPTPTRVGQGQPRHAWAKANPDTRYGLGIPFNPDRAYRGDGWTNWPDFLGTASRSR